MGVSIMSRLNELIKNLCPNGVEFKQLGDCLLKVNNIKWAETNNEQYRYIDLASVDRDTHQIIDTQIITSENAPSRAQQIVNSGDVLLGTTRPMLKRYCLLDGEYDNQICSTGFCVLRANEDIVLRKWIYHQIASSDFYIYVEKYQKGASYPAIADVDVKSYRIPVPPLSVQREIVRILDYFWDLVTALTAEYNARKMQFDFYSNKLFESAVVLGKWMTIDEVIFSLKTGLNPRQNFKLNSGGNRPYITGKDIYNNSINVSAKTDRITDADIALINRRACLGTNDVLFASTGTGTVGRMAVVDNYDNTWAVSETMFCLKPKTEIIHPYYLMYALYTQSAKKQFEPKISKGSVPHLKVQDLLDVKIPVPDLKEQNRIVDLMRKFDILCNDISEGLPAEIEARRKQYEYYRDKVLTFKQLP